MKKSSACIVFWYNLPITLHPKTIKLLTTKNKRHEI